MINLNVSRIHYVYAYLDPRKPGQYVYDNFNFSFEPIYIGLGKGLRYKEHLIDAKNLKKSGIKLNKIRKIQKEIDKDPEIIFIKKNLSIDESRELEKKLINEIGCLFNKTGPLTNLCEGGSTGPVGFKMNTEQRETRRRNCKEFWKNQNYREKVITSMKQLWLDEDFRKTNIAERKKRASTPEAREKNRQAQLIAQNRPEVKKRMCEIQKRNWSREEVKQKVRKRYRCLNISSNKYYDTDNLMKFCDEYNLNYFGMQNCVTGFQKQHRGWTCYKLSGE